MRRRRFLARLGAAGGLAGLAGCLAPPAADTDAAAADDATTRPFDPSLAAQGFPPTVCSEALRPGGIRAVVDPAFAPDWSAAAVDTRYTRDGRLGDDAVVVGLSTAGGRARAYPLSVLSVHEVVNDAFDGPVAVTYCPICRSGVVFDRRVDGVATTFHVSGLLWQPPRIRARAAEQDGGVFGAAETDPDAAVRVQGNLVLYDAATESYWSQVLATAICGPRTGADLALRPAAVTTWGDWRAEYPDTEVLLPPPTSGLD